MIIINKLLRFTWTIKISRDYIWRFSLNFMTKLLNMGTFHTIPQKYTMSTLNEIWVQFLMFRWWQDFHIICFFSEYSLIIFCDKLLYDFSSCFKPLFMIICSAIYKFTFFIMSFHLKWEIGAFTSPYKCGTRRCDPCLTEKLSIIRADPIIILNKRT